MKFVGGGAGVRMMTGWNNVLGFRSLRVSLDFRFSCSISLIREFSMFSLRSLRPKVVFEILKFLSSEC